MSSLFRAARSAASSLVQAVGIAPVARPDKPVEEYVPIDSVTATPEDKEFLLPHVFNDWSIRRSLGGDFVAPQGASLVHSVIQIEATAGRTKIITGKVLGLDFHRMRAKTSANDGKIFYINLGTALPSYRAFLAAIRPNRNLYADDVAGIFAKAAE